MKYISHHIFVIFIALQFITCQKTSKTSQGIRIKSPWRSETSVEEIRFMRETGEEYIVSVSIQKSRKRSSPLFLRHLTIDVFQKTEESNLRSLSAEIYNHIKNSTRAKNVNVEIKFPLPYGKGTLEIKNENGAVRMGFSEVFIKKFLMFNETLYKYVHLNPPMIFTLAAWWPYQSNVDGMGVVDFSIQYLTKECPEHTIAEMLGNLQKKLFEMFKLNEIEFDVLYTYSYSRLRNQFIVFKADYIREDMAFY